MTVTYCRDCKRKVQSNRTVTILGDIVVCAECAMKFDPNWRPSEEQVARINAMAAEINEMLAEARESEAGDDDETDDGGGAKN